MMTHEQLSHPGFGPEVTGGLARLLVATDFSPRATCALTRALQLPLRQGAEVLLAHVLPPAAATSAPSAEEEALARHCLQEAVSHVRERLSQRAGQVHGLLVRGPPDEALTFAAKDFGAEVVVLGRPHRPSSLRGRIRERVAGGHIQHLPTTLLLVGTPPVQPYRRPLVAVDFSEASRHALEATLGLCPHAERVLVLHDYDTSYELVLHQAAPLSRSLEYRREAQAQARAALQQFLAPYQDAGVRLETFVRPGEAAESIVAVARQEQADLIAVGRHERAGLGRLVRPHVAEQLVSETSCDVLILAQEPRAGSGQRPAPSFPLETL
jgi:nucleotide-binding universal stress UspA family protein